MTDDLQTAPSEAISRELAARQAGCEDLQQQAMDAIRQLRALLLERERTSR
jgi:hypothetical protein